MIANRAVWAALSTALAMQVAMVIGYGFITDWCFCAITGSPSPPVPPPFLMRFLELATLPVTSSGLAVQPLFVFSVIGWFAVLLVLLEGMVLAARIRLRADRSALAGDGWRLGLVSRKQVRVRHILPMVVLLIAAGAAGGMLARQRWLAKAERVFAASMAAASTGRPLPGDVEFSMVERRGEDYVYVDPAPGFAIEADPHQSGDHFLDRFVTPYAYGGWVRFPSGARYEFTVLRWRFGWPADRKGWTITLYSENAFRW